MRQSYATQAYQQVQAQPTQLVYLQHAMAQMPVAGHSMAAYDGGASSYAHYTPTHNPMLLSVAPAPGSPTAASYHTGQYNDMTMYAAGMPSYATAVPSQVSYGSPPMATAAGSMQQAMYAHEWNNPHQHHPHQQHHHPAAITAALAAAAHMAPPASASTPPMYTGPGNTAMPAHMGGAAAAAAATNAAALAAGVGGGRDRVGSVDSHSSHGSAQGTMIASPYGLSHPLTNMLPGTVTTIPPPSQEQALRKTCSCKHTCFCVTSASASSLTYISPSPPSPTYLQPHSAQHHRL